MYLKTVLFETDIGSLRIATGHIGDLFIVCQEILYER
jgi:hypothetical protein